MDISGKTAIVTGAASGIGLGIATALAEAGANVVMADIQKAAVGQATQLRQAPHRLQQRRRADAWHADDRRAARRLGVRDWREHLGIIHGIRHFVPAILQHGKEGHIVNTASVAGFQNRRGTNQGPYSMSKYAAVSLSEALEIELEGTNVSVSVLCPGPIATNIARGARNRPDHMGGPQIRANDEATLAERLATTGLDPKKVGERVMDAIRTKTFYAFVSAVPADVIRARHRRIEEALNSPWVTHY